MEVTTKELRIQPGKILEQVSNGQEVTVTYRGKSLAKIVPIDSKNQENTDISLFGLWKNHTTDLTVEEQVRDMRKRRAF